VRARLRARRADEGGAIALFTATVSVAILVVAGLAVDIGNTWAQRGQLQVQADRAATFAAEMLPADTAADRLEVAKAAAYYIACHPLPDQRDAHPEIPACPTGNPASPTLDAYANQLLTGLDPRSGRVGFPTRNQVSVLVPSSQIDFGFGAAAGASGTEQQKTATAKIASPGLLSPMALSLDCLLNSGANVLGGGGVPFGYISTTHQGSGTTSTTTTWPTTLTYADVPDLNGVSPGRVTQVLSVPGVPVGPLPTVVVSGSGWPTLTAGQQLAVVFKQGTGTSITVPPVDGTLVLEPGTNRRRLGSVSVQVPAEVAGQTGEWQVKVRVTGGTAPTTYSLDTSTLDVDPLLGIDDVGDVSCGRLLKSPRAGTQANVNFELNLQEGIDHLITTYPSLLSASTTNLSFGELQSLVGLTECGPQRVVDTNGNLQGQTPNCVVTNMSNAYEAGFTPGMIGPQGRLACTSDHPCRPGESFTLGGVTLNDDEFTDFVRSTSLLSSSTFFNLDTFLRTDLPVLTPTSNLDRSIYESHRFMWVAVVSTAGATSAVQAGDYPVLTFRPIFITQSEALSSLPLLDQSLLSPLVPTVGAAVSLIDSAMRLLLQPGVSDQRGLLVDGSGRLSAVRFMTIAPGALPAVPADYAGAESDYLGVGPKIIRLVR